MTGADGDRLPAIAVVGRFQPFHVAHLELVHHALAHADQVLVGITNPDSRSQRPLAGSAHRHQAEANPFSYLDRARMVRAGLDAAGVAPARVDVVPFPFDSSEVCSSYIPLSTPQLVRVYSAWEDEKLQLLERLGYPVLRLAGDPADRVCASDIRAALDGPDDGWRRLVPPGALQVLDDVLARRDRAQPVGSGAAP